MRDATYKDLILQSKSSDGFSDLSGNEKEEMVKYKQEEAIILKEIQELAQAEGEQLE